MVRTEGIVLREMNYGETSKILTIYTRELGKISVMVKGATSPRSKFIANTQVFSLNEFRLKKGKNFYYIIDADLLDSYYGMRENIERVSYGYYILELMDKSVAMEQESKLLYELLKKALKILSALEDNYLKFILGYEVKFISFLGYRPVLDNCLNCSSTNFKALRFSLDNGGILCEKCFNLDRFSRPISREIYVIIYSALYSSLEELYKIEASREDLNLAHNLLVDYILYSIDRKKFNSLVFLETII